MQNRKAKTKANLKAAKWQQIKSITQLRKCLILPHDIYTSSKHHKSNNIHRDLRHMQVAVILNLTTHIMY